MQQRHAKTRQERAGMQFQRGGIEKWLGGTQKEPAKTQFQRKGIQKERQGTQQ